MGRRNRAFKLPVVEKPQVDQKRDEPEGAKAKELKISTTSPREGAKTVETKIAVTSPHEETVAVHSFELCVIEDVFYKGVDFFDFMNSLSDGSVDEESLPSDNDAYCTVLDPILYYQEF